MISHPPPLFFVVYRVVDLGINVDAFPFVLVTGERAVVSYTEGQRDGHGFYQPVEHDSVRVVQNTVSTQEALDVSGTTSLEAEGRLRGDTDDRLACSTSAEIDHDMSKDEAEVDNIPLRTMRPIPAPPPVNLRSKPMPPSSPPFSPPPKTPFQARRVNEEECPPSPDIPPRPVPPPGRSGTCQGIEFLGVLY